MEVVNTPCSDSDDPSFTADGLLLFFNCNHNGDPDIWLSTRGDLDEGWGTASPVDELSSGSPETNVAISADGLRIWFARDDAGDFDIYTSSRGDRTEQWETLVTPIAALNTPEGNEYPCAVTADRKTMVYARGASTQKLYVTDRDSTADPWTEGSLIAELDGSQSNQEAWLSPNGLHMYFTSERSGGYGDSDIYRAWRATRTDSFSTPENVGAEINSNEVESDPWLSPNRSYIMFVRGDGNRQIFEASRTVDGL